MAQLFMARLPLSLAGISWPLIALLAQLQSTIKSKMIFFYLYKANFAKLRLVMDVSFRPRQPSRVTNMPPKRMYPSLLCTFYFSSLHSHHVFFDFESEKAVHTDHHLLRHVTWRCRQLIPFGLCWYINLCLIGLWRPPLKHLELSALCQPVHWKKVTLYNYTINA